MAPRTLISTVPEFKNALNKGEAKSLPLKVECPLLERLYEEQQSTKNSNINSENQSLLKLIYIKQRRFEPCEKCSGEKIKEKYDCDYHGDGLKEFRREESLSLHTNPFIVPLWASAETKNCHHPYGYLIYPRLKPLISCLDELTEQDILRCLLHVALALDFLHTPVPGKRASVYHRLVNIENIYLDRNKNARLGGLRFATETHGPNYQRSLSREKEYEEFHKHPSLQTPLTLYTRQCEWYSFALVALRMLHKLNAVDLNRVVQLIKKSQLQCSEILEKIKEYTHRDHISDVFYESTIELVEHLVQNSASEVKDCRSKRGRHPLNGADCKHKGLHTVNYGGHEENNCVYCPPHLEYKLSPVTAEIRYRLATHESPDQNNKLSVDDVGKRCISCLFTQRGTLNTSRSNWGLGCDSRCTYYCNRCYANREPLYCPEHFTATTIIGHTTAYALILYGDHKEGQRQERKIFQEDATKVKNCLRHFHINGISDNHMVFEKLYSLPLGETTPENLLEEACKQLKKLMDDNTGKKQLTIFYSGHGKDLHPTKPISKDRFAWNPEPLRKMYISLSRVEEIIYEHLLKENKDLGNFVAVLDHCYPIPLFTSNYYLEPSGSIVCGDVGKKALYSCKTPGCHGSCITHLFCQFLRSNWNKDCDNNNNEPECGWCNKTRKCVESAECLTLEALRHTLGHVVNHHECHAPEGECELSHWSETHNTPRSRPVGEHDRSDIFLGFYNPAGIFFMLKELNLTTGMGTRQVSFPYPFEKEVTSDCIKSFIKDKVLEKKRILFNYESLGENMFSVTNSHYHMTVSSKGKQLCFRVMDADDGSAENHASMLESEVLGYVNDETGQIFITLKEVDEQGDTLLNDLTYEHSSTEDISLEKIQTFVRKMIRDRMDIILFTDSSEYYRYSLPFQHELRSALEHCNKQLYYSEVNNQEKHLVRVESRTNPEMWAELQIPCDMDMHVREYQNNRMVTRLPNVLVWVLHYLMIHHQQGHETDNLPLTAATPNMSLPANTRAGDIECICLQFRNFLLRMQKMTRCSEEKELWMLARASARQLENHKTNIHVAMMDKAETSYKVIFGEDDNFEGV